jgi:hypothetical protein
MSLYISFILNKPSDLEQQIINYLLKLEDGITPIEITEFVRTVIKMNSVMNFTIFSLGFLNIPRTGKL